MAVVNKIKIVFVVADVLYSVVVPVAPVDFVLAVTDLFNVLTCNKKIIFIIINNQYARKMVSFRHEDYV